MLITIVVGKSEETSPTERPEEEKMKKVTINIPVTMDEYQYEYAQRMAKLEGMSVNAFILKDFVPQF